MIRRHREAGPGNAGEVDELFDRCWMLIWPVAFGIVGNRGGAEDAAQEAVIRVFRSLDSFDRERPLEPWVRKIAANAAISELRRYRRELSMPADELESLGDHRSSPSEIEGDIAAALDKLSPEKRAVVVLHYWLDYSLRETAEILGLPLGTAASHLARARERIRLTLEEGHA